MGNHQEEEQAKKSILLPPSSPKKIPLPHHDHSKLPTPTERGLGGGLGWKKQKHDPGGGGFPGGFYDYAPFHPQPTPQAKVGFIAPYHPSSPPKPMLLLYMHKRKAGKREEEEEEEDGEGLCRCLKIRRLIAEGKEEEEEENKASQKRERAIKESRKLGGNGGMERSIPPSLPASPPLSLFPPRAESQQRFPYPKFPLGLIFPKTFFWQPPTFSKSPKHSFLPFFKKNVLILIPPISPTISIF